MTTPETTVVTADEAEDLAAEGLRWLAGTARETPGGGLAWPNRPSDDGLDPTLYSGTAGIIPVLLEAWRHFGDDSWADTALRAARGLAGLIDTADDDSLYFGRTGMALVLRAVHDDLGDRAAGAAADRVLAQVRANIDGARWGELFDLMGGNAGIGLGALLSGDPGLAVLALEPYLRAAEPTEGGVQWAFLPDVASRLHHISHGTLGIVSALARVGAATGRTDLLDLALSGAAGVLARDEAGPDGFLVPHSTPQYRPEGTARISYGWCHGPTGDAQVFRLLRNVTGDPAWQSLADRCWHTITRSGLPRRPRPGFWDNNGRCCGTAGVLALACDRIAEQRDAPDFAHVLVVTSPPAPSGTPTGPAGPTSSTGPPRAPSNRGPAGPWATRASSANSCATPVSCAPAPPPTRSPGPISPRHPHRASPTTPGSRGRQPCRRHRPPKRPWQHPAHAPGRARALQGTCKKSAIGTGNPPVVCCAQQRVMGDACPSRRRERH